MRPGGVHRRPPRRERRNKARRTASEGPPKTRRGKGRKRRCEKKKGDCRDAFPRDATRLIGQRGPSWNESGSVDGHPPPKNIADDSRTSTEEGSSFFSSPSSLVFPPPTKTFRFLFHGILFLFRGMHAHHWSAATPRPLLGKRGHMVVKSSLMVIRCPLQTV